MVRIGLEWEKNKKEQASPLRYGTRCYVGSADMRDPLIRCEEWGGKCDVGEKETSGVSMVVQKNSSPPMSEAPSISTPVDWGE